MRLLAVLAALALAVAAIAVGSGAAAPQEYEVKAAFIYNFTKFVEWPADAFPKPDSPIVIGIVGKDPFGATIDRTVQGKSANGRPLVVRRVRWGPEMRQCHILFVSSSEKSKLGQLDALLQGAPTLSVGETDGFPRHGGILNFILEENKVRFEVNVDAARRAHLTISSKLLSLARIARSS